MTGADPPQENIAVPLGVAGGDSGLPVRIALNINESGLIVKQGSSTILTKRFTKEHNTMSFQKIPVLQ
jgi:hypothetical protein